MYCTVQHNTITHRYHPLHPQPVPPTHNRTCGGRNCRKGREAARDSTPCVPSPSSPPPLATLCTLPTAACRSTAVRRIAQATLLAAVVGVVAADAVVIARIVECVGVPGGPVTHRQLAEVARRPTIPTENFMLCLVCARVGAVAGRRACVVANRRAFLFWGSWPPIGQCFKAANGRASRGVLRVLSHCACNFCHVSCFPHCCPKSISQSLINSSGKTSFGFAGRGSGIDIASALSRLYCGCGASTHSYSDIRRSCKVLLSTQRFTCSVLLVNKQRSTSRPCLVCSCCTDLPSISHVHTMMMYLRLHCVPYAHRGVCWVWLHRDRAETRSCALHHICGVHEPNSFASSWYIVQY